MAKKNDQTNMAAPASDASRVSIVPMDISKEMRDSYLDYAMSVITSRALPDARDGLKPVHRRILFSMHEMGLTSSAKFRKSAAVVGDVLGKYHPHGDASVYDAMVKMAQDFSFRYPLVMGQGNFGCFTKDTKIKLTDGRELSFEDLIKEYQQGKKNHTYTVNKVGLIAIAEIKNPRLTREGAEIVKVVLDNGEEIRCTPDHRFMLRNGEYKEARYLNAGESLMPIYQKFSEKTDRINRDGYVLIYQNKKDEWVPAHHLADNYNLSKGKYAKSAGRVRHHADFNKLNNDPGNIERMHWGEHWEIHYTHASDLHKNSEYRKKIAEGRDSYWADPKNKAKHAKLISERNVKNWQDPEYRERMSGILSESNKEYIANHPEKRIEFSTRATSTLKRLWQTPGYRESMHEKIIKGNKNHTTNKTGRNKFLNICKEALGQYRILSKENYDLAREKIYSYGSAPLWETGVNKYFQGDQELILRDINGNHKVVRIEKITQREDVYDLTIDGTHNFALASGVFVHNSVDGDAPAAMRYTEAKMSRVSAELLRDLEKETVDFRPNYDGTRKEPVVLPSAVPGLLLNGTLGIAVGMATNIPPHNLSELVDATVHLIDDPEATSEDLLKYVKGPDFPTGGVVFGEKDMHHAYTTGRGGVVVRGEAEIVDEKNTSQIIITSLPYRVNKAELIVKIADLVREKKLEGIRGLRDESTRDIRVVIDLKSGAHPQAVLNYLYKHTDLENSFHYNMVALVDGVPQTLSLKSLLATFIGHRQVVVRRRTEYDLRKAEEREHILLGLKKALDHIDRVITIIRGSKDAALAKANLIKEFKFSDIQATAILEMKLQKLAGLERKNVELELKEKQEFIKECKELLASPKKILAVVKKELGEVKEKYGDDRKSRVVKHGAQSISVEDMIPDEESMLVYTKGGYIKRTNPSEYRKQNRGGVGVVDLNTKDEDFITLFMSATTHSDMLFFSDKGKAYQIKMYDIPEGKRATRGKSIMNFIALSAEEKVTSILAMPKSVKESKLSLFMVTKQGTIKKSSAESFKDVRRSGIIAIRLEKDDELLAALFAEKGDDIILTTAKGQAIRFKESDAREMGRTAGGVRGMKLRKGDFIVGADVVKKDAEKPELLVMSENGYGKKTALKEYKVQKRGGSGIKTAKVTAKIGPIITAKVVTPAYEELVAISKKAQVIRIDMKSVPSLGRDTQGVRIMKLYEGDSIASLTCL